MFKIINNTIHCSRGDKGTIILKIPITDVNNYIKYVEDITQNVYWYNTKNKELYDANYNLTSISIDNLKMECYQFQTGDKVKFCIYEKNGYGKKTVMQKELTVSETVEKVYIELTENETTFGSPVNKPTVFWYDITLNNDLTVICYDENGAKEFIEYPARGDDENDKN